MPRSIAKFSPSTLWPVAESEAHYLGVHVGLARSGFMADEEKLAYSTWKVLAQYDATGGWNHRITAWRFVSTVVTDAASGGTMLKDDIQQCLRDMRRTPVVEDCIVSRESKALSKAKYVFELDRSPSQSREQAKVIIHEMVDALKRRISLVGEQGLRRLAVCWVTAEEETLPQSEPGQIYTGNLRETSKVAYIEADFDSWYWGDRFFGDADLSQRLLDPTFAVANGYKILEQCEYDSRGEGGAL